MKKKKVSVLTEDWKVYHALQSFPVMLPSAPEDIHLVVFPTVAKGKRKRNSSRKDDSVEYSYLAYRFLGLPDEVQAHELSCIMGSCRFLWNRMLADRRDLYRELGVTVKNTPADYKDIPELYWLKDCDSLALCNVQLNLESAYSDGLSGKAGMPRFKKKGVAVDSYKTNLVGDNVRLEDGKLRLPKITGYIRLKQHRKVRPGGILKNVTVIHEPDGKWYFSMVYAYEKQDVPVSVPEGEDIKAIGLDMSLPELYLDSNGDTPFYTLNGNKICFSKAYRKLEKKIGREQRRLSHMEKGSSNYRKQCRKVAKLHAKAKHQRNDFLHQMAVRLVREYDVIGIEDIDLAGMKKALRFGKSLSDNGWGNFIRILEEKCTRHGTLLIRVDRWYPSSKTCSSCGHVLTDLELSDRIYVCPVCGNILDRDVNAAINIREEALRILSEYVQHEKTEKLPDSYHYQTA